MTEAVFNDFHLFGGSGGGALGFSWARRNLGPVSGRFQCIGSVDVSANRTADFSRLLATPGTQIDLFDEESYLAFHAKYDRQGNLVKRAALPRTWRPAAAEDLRRAAGGRRPHVIFLSAPCKGFSGLLSGTLAGSPKYQALNRLTVRGIRLALEAWKDDPPEFVVFENVPRIAQRGAALVEEIVALLMKYGYAVHRDAHDCGELGGLAQHRKRFLLLARHVGKVRPFVYQPPKLRVRAIGEVIGPLPMPEDAAGGPMHRLPRLKLQTLLRLALIPAGKDWRALNDIDVSRLRLVPAAAIRKGGAHYNNVYRVIHWEEPAGAVTSGHGPSSGGICVADPRPPAAWAGSGKYKVTPPDEPAGTVIAESNTGNGAFAFADARLPETFGEHGTKLQVDPVDRPARTVTGARVGSGAPVIADVRLPDGTAWRGGVMGVQHFDEPSDTITSRSTPTTGAYTVADPRPIDEVQLKGGYGAKSVTLRVKSMDAPAPTVAASSSVWDSAGFAVEEVRLPNARPRNGTMKVQDWHRPGDTVTAASDVWAGSSAVADVREPQDGDLVVIISEDGTWHRPLTAWELAALQSMPLWIDGEPLVLAGSPTEWRQAIGNMVPPMSAKAIAEVLLDALLEEVAGVTFKLSSNEVWVSPDDQVGRGLGWVG